MHCTLISTIPNALTTVGVWNGNILCLAATIYSHLVFLVNEFMFMWVPRVSLLQASGYLQHVLDELDEKTPALQQLRRNYETAMKNCDQLTAQLTSTVEVQMCATGYVLRK